MNGDSPPIDNELISGPPAASSAEIPGGFENPPLVGAPTKPDEFIQETWGNRLLKANKPLTAKHKKFCECVAQGMTVPQIKEITGYTDAWISTLKSNDKINEEISRLQDRLFSETVQQQLANLGNDAVSTVEEMLRSDGEKLRDRVETARWLIEKLTGKARQEMEINSGSTLLQLLQKLDALRTAEPGDQRQVIELTKEKTEDAWMDNWVGQNIPVVDSEKKEGGTDE